jgi:hypothetical protein
VIAALEEPTPDRRPTMTRLEAHASPRALAGALAIAVLPFTRQLIADLLGRQADPAGAAALLSALADRNPRVRSSAADALGKIMLSHGPASVPGAGPALLAAYTAEDSAGARHMLAAAFGRRRRARRHPAARSRRGFRGSWTGTLRELGPGADRGPGYYGCYTEGKSRLSRRLPTAAPERPRPSDR